MDDADGPPDPAPWASAITRLRGARGSLSAARAAKGRLVGGRVPFGYLGVGKGAEGKLQEAPAQAEVVRLIFADSLRA